MMVLRSACVQTVNDNIAIKLIFAIRYLKVIMGSNDGRSGDLL